MSKGSGGGTNTVTQNSAPPPEVMAQYNNIIGQANNAAAQPLQQYNGQVVAGFNPDQEQAFSSINNAQGIAQPYYGQAQNLFTQSSQPVTASPITADTISQYSNPYTQDVINSTLAQMNQQDQQQQSTLMGNAASQGAWGGDRSGVAQGILGGQQALARNQTIAGLNNQNYTQALGEANTQQQANLGAQEASGYLGQQGAFGLANLGTTAQTSALQGASSQLQSGGLQQQLAQEQLNVPYEQYLQQQSYPFQNIGWLSGISTGLGSGSGGTSTTTSPGASAASSLAGLGIGGLSLYGAVQGASGAARGGAINGESGIAKRVEEGKLYVMPAHYDTGGIARGYANGGYTIPGQVDISQMQNSSIPDLTRSYIPGNPSSPAGHGIGIPSGGSVSKTTPDKEDNSSFEKMLANPAVDKYAAKGIKSLLSPSAPSGLAAGVATDTSPSAMVASAYPDFAAADPKTGLFSIADNANSPDVLTNAINSGVGFDSNLSEAAGLAPTASSADVALPEALGTDFGAGALDAASTAGALDAGASAAGTALATDAAATAAASTAADATAATLPEWLPALMALFNRGGTVGYDDGGAVLTPFEQTANPSTNNQTASYAGMSTEQLRELASRTGGEQGSLIQKVLQQKQMMPDVKARGGIIKTYADGGSDDYTSPELESDMANADTNARGTGIVPGDFLSELTNTPSSGGIGSPPTSTPTPDTISIPESSGIIGKSRPVGDILKKAADDYEPTAPIHKANPWLALAAAGFGMAAGNSPHTLQNVATGALAGLKNYGEQQDQEAKESYQQGSLKKAAQQLAQEADYHSQQLSHENDQLKQTGDYQQKELGLRQQELGLRGAALKQKSLLKDAMGNPIGWADPTTGDITPIKGLPTPGSNPTVDPTTGDLVSQNGGFGFKVAPVSPVAYKALVAEDSKRRQADNATSKIGDNILGILDELEPNLNSKDFPTGTMAPNTRASWDKFWGNSGAEPANNIEKGTNALATEVNKFQYVPGARGSVLGLKTILASKPGIEQQPGTNQNIMAGLRSRVYDSKLSSELAETYREASPYKITDHNTDSLDQALKTIYPLQTIDSKTGKVAFNAQNVQNIRDAIPDAIANPSKYLSQARSMATQSQSSAAPSAASSTSAVPQAAIDHLRANPALAPQFEQKYGVTANQYLQ